MPRRSPAAKAEGRRDAHRRAGRLRSAAVALPPKSSAAALGRIDILVNSAGITGATAPVHEYPARQLAAVIDVNLNGLFYCCREVVPFMLANGYGRIVNVASVAGKEGNPNASAYSASKAGVIGLTKSLGKELAGKGIIANALTPATFESPILEQLPPSQVDYMRSKIPMGRLGEAGERRDGPVHGERGMQLHHGVDLRHVGWADDVLTISVIPANAGISGGPRTACEALRSRPFAGMTKRGKEREMARDLPFIDAHVHLWDLDRIAIPG
jgi:hypothetical protein